MALNAPVTSWAGRRCWLIGASSGIGAALAEALGTRGARLAISARRRESLEALAIRIGGDVRVLPFDATPPGATARAHAELLAAWGEVDLVVYLAGDYVARRAWELDMAEARKIVDVNLMGALELVASIVPALVARRGGAIAIVSSVAGYGGLPNGLVYGATKAALVNLCETLYLDLAPRGVGVHLVMPGFVRTPLTAQNRFPMPFLIEPEEAARQIIRGLERGAFEIHFPKAFSRMLKTLALLPYSLYFRAVRRATGL